MNRVQLLGNLARDPEIRYTAKGTPVATFTVAASNTYVDVNSREAKEQTTFVNCVAWNKLAEEISGLRKGDRCFVEGRLQTRSYEKDGRKVYVTEVVCNFVGSAFGNQGAIGGNAGSSNFNKFGAPTDADEEIPF